MSERVSILIKKHELQLFAVSYGFLVGFLPFFVCVFTTMALFFRWIQYLWRNLAFYVIFFVEFSKWNIQDSLYSIFGDWLRKNQFVLKNSTDFSIEKQGHTIPKSHCQIPQAQKKRISKIVDTSSQMRFIKQFVDRFFSFPSFSRLV